MVGILVSVWDDLFSGAMLVSGRVIFRKLYIIIPKPEFMKSAGGDSLILTTLFGDDQPVGWFAMIYPDI